MILLLSLLPSVASASFREIPCYSVAMLMLGFLSFLPSVANASVSAYSSFRSLFSASAFSVFFRVRPWQMLLPLLLLISVSFRG